MTLAEAETGSLLIPAAASLGEWSALLEAVSAGVKGDPFWEPRLSGPECAGGLHLAVLREPYLGFMLDGRKTVESRFSVRRVAPFQQVRPSDVLLLKRVAGPIAGLCEVTDTWFYTPADDSWELLRETFAQPLCAEDDGFWESRRSARYATLMRIARVRRVDPITCQKRDRRGWVVIKASEPESPAR